MMIRLSCRSLMHWVALSSSFGNLLALLPVLRFGLTLEFEALCVFFSVVHMYGLYGIY